MPGGGLMQLVAYGAEDMYLTGNTIIRNPPITRKKPVNRIYVLGNCVVCYENLEVMECGTCVAQMCKVCYDNWDSTDQSKGCINNEIYTKCVYCKNDFDELTTDKKYFE
jgi:hypothetical protein